MPRNHAKTFLGTICLAPHILIQPKESNCYFPGLDGSDNRILLVGETASMGQKNLQATADSTKIKVDVILSRQLDGLIVNTTERTKLGILFWFLMVCGVAMISSLVSFLMKKLGV